jgi:arginyl-tRNA synthetase
MKEIKNEWKDRLFAALEDMAARRNLSKSFTPEQIVLEKPPRPDLGDLAVPLFPFARIFKAAPPKLGEELAAALTETFKNAAGPVRFVPAGPYLNIHLPRSETMRKIFARVSAEEENYGRSDLLSGQKIMIEFSSPNTNKPLHLGHLRNDALGESVARILKTAGAEVCSVDLINDRGIHICKSMLAYKKAGGGKTPESENLKSDHFVGKYYVLYNDMAKNDPSLEEEAREMLRMWEDGNAEVRALWETMNHWAIGGIKETYKKTGIRFDKFYYESQVYEKGREEILEGLKRGIFYKDSDGSVWVDLAEIGLDKKVLLRSDGTTLYLTQDIGTAISRRHDWPFDRLIYVVASEQNYHFAVLFYVLKLLGYPWAENLYHLSYGMVNLPEGKMKSREGTVVDADDLIQELADMAAAEIRAKERESDVGDVAGISEKIALGAIHYYLLQPAPAKDMIFNPRESLSFTGNTGPYLQYMGARISSLLRKYAEETGAAASPLKPELLAAEEEWRLVKLIGEFPETLEQAAETRNPSLIAAFLYETAKNFSHYYHDYPILRAENPGLVFARITLSRCVLAVLRRGMYMLNIPFLEVM